ncbi:collagenase [Streptomyces sp. FH025]|uniref:collagenase n=1 Tax=Streptomyces sp. FH025 TaxID=2815937 RepID=UPI001A9FBDC0|nr:collagenase [Streptomyces sp. FH025]MBO1413048.1 collagenase [Streptomyces sp. FH025]
MPIFLASIAAATTTLLGLAATPSLAAAPTPTPVPSVRPASADRLPLTGAATTDPASPGVPQGHRLTPAQLPPLSAPASPEPAPSKAAPHAFAAAPAATASCSPADFSGRSGAALVSFVKASTPQCVSTLFYTSGSEASAVFRQSQMATVADAFQGAAATYPGDNSTSVQQLVLFLRAGYYVQSNDPKHIPGFDSSLTGAVARGIDTFIAGPHFADATDANGQVASEVVILTDNTSLQGRYLGTYKQVVNGYNDSYNASKNLANLVNSVFNALDRGHDVPDFVTAVTADPSIIDTLNAFARNHRDLLGTDNAYLDANAGFEVARFLKYPAFQAKVRPLVKALLDTSSMTGPTAPLWVGTAARANFFDPDQCSYYGVCDLTNRLTKAALPISYTCDAGRTILAQDLTAADLAAVCANLKGEDAFFHNLVRDNGPVPGQYESSVQIVVFASQADYRTYAGAIFGANTNNGGITLTGDPSKPANQVVSIMYRHPTDNGFTARIWNLNHEYAHVLDARYDFKGDFWQQVSVPDLWWLEGVAEYVSYTYRGVTDTMAVAQAPKHTYTLSTLFQSTYLNSDLTRTYPWGYLAVRHMVERYPSVIQGMLYYFRTGNYAQGYGYYNAIGTLYDAGFNSWLDACATDLCLSPGTPTAAFDATVTGLTAQLTDRSTETGGKGTITSRAWNFGDGTTSTEASPWKTYAAPGTYTVTLTVTDSNGKTATTSKPVTATPPAAPTACTGADARAMDRNCFRTGRSADAGSLDMLYIYMPAGTVTLNVTTTGGTGTAYLYYNSGTWASDTAYTASSTNNGNQSITVTNSTAGYRYISLYGKTAFSGVTVTTQY